MTAYTRSPERAAGFTLIELAVVLFILTLLLSSLLVPLGTQINQSNINTTQKSLDDVKEALIGFALANGYLPCPDKTSGPTTGPNDTPNDGAEDVAGGLCVTQEGNVPWSTLGVGSADVWGNRLRYRVVPAFAQRPPGATFSLSSSANLRLCTTAACTTTLTSSAPNGAPAVILSHGKNGLGAINSVTGAANPAPSSADELENTNSDTTFVSRAATDIGAGAGEFDDIVAWLSTNILLNRMVAAGKLP
ncbi:MAG TPA: prepilin-type N-terminal cleavage/methylation domain-containing protein [Burkholderiales bacterium]|nr:prepilin-type N-terminal cleavage/methylation domain-containing protein [Burkholderiales bacterium]